MIKQKLYSLFRSMIVENEDGTDKEVFESLIYKATSDELNNFIQENSDIMLFPEELLIVEVKEFSMDIKKSFDTEHGGTLDFVLAIKE